MSDNADRFFEETESHFYNRGLCRKDYLYCQVRYAKDEWRFYQYAYQNALEILIKHQKDYPGRQTYLVIPTLFLYRHLLEISIKTLILIICERYAFSCPKFDHRLSSLWEKFYQLLEKTSHKAAFAEIKSDVEKLLKEIEKIDPDDKGFRYPEDKNRLPYFESKEVISVNIQTMEKLIFCFDCLHTALDHEMKIE